MDQSRYPWKLADWKEEVLQILSQLRYSCYHILRVANEIADGLAREGAPSKFSFFFCDVSLFCVSYFSLLCSKLHSPFWGGALLVLFLWVAIKKNTVIKKQKTKTK